MTYFCLSSDYDVITQESEWVVGGNQTVPRANLAKFMLKQLTDTTWERKYVAIAMSKSKAQSAEPKE